ncbi:transport and Golgi organization protein 1 homolog isoform X2 [Bombina bombina]|uniref:transport and Golgi organization protein 1 homolog isoform X2 n=1 Tax=Bombina bombina TaxID=8345 RepID=UPI00235A4FC0|nr:transport and Golgi organization protein 1 homolog isoform X2 [Bombina bombina]
MAEARSHVYLLLLFAHLTSCSTAQDRRFSDLKRCGDEECSMLMSWGIALEDFTGPDCRFLNFKKNEQVYVYYKLAGKSSDLWAGTVDNNFGYFPKDLLDIRKVHIKDELELPTDETDFVCFDAGTDAFDNYNVDELLNKPKEANTEISFSKQNTDLQTEPSLELQKEFTDTDKPPENTEKQIKENSPKSKDDTDEKNSEAENTESKVKEDHQKSKDDTEENKTEAEVKEDHQKSKDDTAENKTEAEEAEVKEDNQKSKDDTAEKKTEAEVKEDHQKSKDDTAEKKTEAEDNQKSKDDTEENKTEAEVKEDHQKSKEDTEEKKTKAEKTETEIKKKDHQKSKDDTEEKNIEQEKTEAEVKEDHQKNIKVKEGIQKNEDDKVSEDRGSTLTIDKQTEHSIVPPPSSNDDKEKEKLEKVDKFNVNSESEKSQEEKIALQSPNETILGNPQVPDSDHAKYNSISQGEALGSNDKHEDLESYTLFNKEKLQVLKTHIGSSADAVVTDDEETRYVTQEYEYPDDTTDEPYDEESEEDLSEQSDEPPLLSYEESGVKSKEETDSINEDFAAQTKPKSAKPEEEVKAVVDEGDVTPVKLEKDILTTLGDTFFAIVSGGEYTDDVTDPDRIDSEEETDEEDDEPLEDENIYLLDMEKHEGRHSDNILPVINTDDHDDAYRKLLQEISSATNTADHLETDQNVSKTVDAPVDDLGEKDKKDAIGENDYVEIFHESPETKSDVISDSEALQNEAENEKEPLDSKNTSTEALVNIMASSDSPDKENKVTKVIDEKKTADDTEGNNKSTDGTQKVFPTEPPNEESQTPYTEKKERERVENVKTKTKAAVDEKFQNDSTGKKIESEDVEYKLPEITIKDNNEIKTLITEEESADRTLSESRKSTDASITGEVLKAQEDSDVETSDIKKKEDVVKETLKLQNESVDSVLKDGEKPTNKLLTEKLPKVLEKTDLKSTDIEEGKKDELQLKEKSVVHENDPVIDTNLKQGHMEHVPLDMVDKQSQLNDSEQSPINEDLKKPVQDEDGSFEAGAVQENGTSTKIGNEEKTKLDMENVIETEFTNEDLVGETENELLEDENAASAQRSKQKLANTGTTIIDSDTVDKAEESVNTQNEGVAVDKTEEKLDEDNDEKYVEENEDENVDVEIEDQSSSPKEDKLVNNSNLNAKKTKDTEALKVEATTPITEDEINSTLLETEPIADVSNQENIHKDDSVHHSDEIANAQQSEKDEDVPHDTGTAGNNATEKPNYTESILKLIIIKEYLSEENIALFRKYLGSENIFKVESMFHDMESELRNAQVYNAQQDSIEKILDQILESSETNILEFVENILDTRVANDEEDVAKTKQMFDEEDSLLENIQEVAYRLRLKHSLYAESSVLTPEIPKETSSIQKEDGAHINEVVSKDQIDQKPGLEDPQSHTEERSAAKVPEAQTEEEEKVLEQPPVNDAETKPGVNISLEESKPGSQDPQMHTAPRDADSVQETPTEDVGITEHPSSVDNTEPEAEITAEDVAETEEKLHETSDDAETEKQSQEISASQIISTTGTVLLAAKDYWNHVSQVLLSALPEYAQPGPDFHGPRGEALSITLLVGVITVFIFMWKTCFSVKSKRYQVTEKQLNEKIEKLMKEKSEALNKISEYEQQIKEAKESETKTKHKNSDLLTETGSLQGRLKELQKANKELDGKIKNLHSDLEFHKEQNKKKQEKLIEGKESVKRLQEVYSQHTAELTEFQIALNEAKLKEQKVRSELCGVQEENVRLKNNKEQLLKEADRWRERQRELDEQIKLQQKSHEDLKETLAHKENEIEVLTACIMQLKHLEEDTCAGEDGGCHQADGELVNGEITDKRKEKMKVHIKQMMDVSRVKTTLSILKEEKELYQKKLSDEITARHELEEQIKKLQHDSSTLQIDKTQLEKECKALSQKVKILKEIYQEEEMALQKKLIEEEYERQEKEEKLTVADEKAILASEEVKIHKQRIQEVEEELQKTERFFKNQIASLEKKAHENWVSARAAERTLAEEKRESANLRQKVLEANQRIAALQKPSIVKPTAGRPEQQQPGRRSALSRDGSFGPSPVSGGASSPMMMMDPSSQPSSANVSRAEHPKRDPAEHSHSAAALNSAPRTSTPSMTVDGMQNPPNESEASNMPASSSMSEDPGTVAPSSHPTTPVPSSPARLIGPPHPRGPFGPRPLLPPQVHGPPPLIRPFFPPAPLPPSDPRNFAQGPFGPREYPPAPMPLPGPGSSPVPPPGVRGFPPGLPQGTRDFQPGPFAPGLRAPPPGNVPSAMRDFPPGSLPPGPRDFPPGSLPPGPRDFPPGSFPPGPRDFPPGSFPPGPRDFPPGSLPPGPRDFPPGPFPPGVREFPPRLPPPGGRNFVLEPPHTGVRDLPPAPHPGSFPGSAEQHTFSPGSHPPTQTDNQDKS